MRGDENENEGPSIGEHPSQTPEGLGVKMENVLRTIRQWTRMIAALAMLLGALARLLHAGGGVVPVHHKDPPAAAPARSAPHQ